MKRALAALAILWIALAGAPAAAAPVNTGHVEIELIAADAWASPGTTLYVALRQKIAPGWHTYWRNPGDSGEPTQLAWTLPEGWRAGEFVWATPRPLPVGPLMNFGYEGEVLLPVPIEVPAGAAVGQVTVRAAVELLVCAEVCIPEAGLVSLTLPVKAAPPTPDLSSAPKISAALAAAPKPAGLVATWGLEAGGLRLAITGAPLAGADAAGARFYPYDRALITPAARQAIDRGPEGLTLRLAPGDLLKTGPPPAEIAGVLALAGGAYEVTATAAPAAAGAGGLGPPPEPVAAASAPPLGLIGALLFAFAGGLILNLMPCVFPILSMKAAALANHAHHEAAARREGAFFGVGVMVTFLGLAASLLAAKAAGESVGWGFQLQSPAVVAALALVMLGVALNLSGVFEIGLSVQGAGQGLTARGGGLGAFFTGVLAVVVAAPCTAPFMAAALGYAFTRPAFEALLVFAALGAGFALPFVAIAFLPALLRRLPRPGPWMETLRRALAFPMYGAAAWLLWVLTIQAGAMGLARLLALAVVIAFAAWLFGLAQRGGRGLLLQAAAGIVALGVMGAAVWPAWPDQTPSVAVAASASATESVDAPFEPWSEARLAALRAEGRPVLVNFTAAWCVTCQVNEGAALSTARFVDALERTDTAYLKGDWTRRDAAITRALEAHGRAGVPLYLLYPADGSPPKVLPQLLSEGAVVAALDAAARPAAPAAR